MNKGLVFLIVIIVIAGICVLSYFGIYNSFVKKEVTVSEAWAQVENVLQRRSDLIPNLVLTVKGYAKHEKEILDNLAKARASYAGAKTIDEKMKAGHEMGNLISRLMVIVENYPNLKANETFIRLMDELAGTENRISIERMKYNAAVSDFNVTIRSIPYNFVANKMGLTPKPFFEAEKGKKEVPTVDFNK